MFCTRKLVILVTLFTSGCSYWQNLHHRSQWNINREEPRIRAFSPKGLKITLHSMRGLSSIKLVGTVFRDSQNIPFEGDFVFDPVRDRRRKWVYENFDIALKVGDVLNYEIYMEGKGGSIFKTYDGNSQIYEIFDYETCQMQKCPLSNIPPTATEGPHIAVATVPSMDKYLTPEPPNLQILEKKLKGCQQNIINVTNVLLELQSQILRLETKNELLLTVLSKSSDAKKLIISGVIPQEGVASDTVQFMIWEKLDLKPHIVSAYRHNATTIVFEVETIEEKLDILGEAEDRLTSGRITIN